MIGILLICITAVFADPLVITLPNGPVRGHELISPENVSFYGFQGIPYATPPVGELRFQAPLPAQNWDGILNVTQDGNSCISRGSLSGNGNSEDCLFINVYTPTLRDANTTDEELLPVIVSIYGGAFALGSSAYSMLGPDYFIEEDIVFVSFNYRTNAFGFLSTEDIVIPGNAGLKDQTLALKWVQQNIHLFGGDKDKVTIFGGSSGGMSVTYHVLSPLSKGLFRAGISGSGTALNYCSVNPLQMNYTRYLLQVLAVNQNLTIAWDNITTQEIKDIFLQQSSDAIAQAVSDIPNDELTKPTIEVPHEGAFLTESPYVLLQNGTFSKVPMLMGFNSEEWLLFVNSIDNLKEVAKSYDEDPMFLIPVDLQLKSDVNATEVTSYIKSIFLEEEQFFQDNLGKAVQYNTENMFQRPITKYAELHSKYNDVYFYQFSYFGELGGDHTYNLTDLLGKVAHGDDIHYLYTSSTTRDLSKYPEQDVNTHKRMVKMWSNFVKYLNPTPEDSEFLQGLKWPIVTPTEFKYVDIDTNLTIVDAYPRLDRYKKWEHVFYTYGQEPFYNF